MDICFACYNKISENIYFKWNWRRLVRLSQIRSTWLQLYRQVFSLLSFGEKIVGNDKPCILICSWSIIKWENNRGFKDKYGLKYFMSIFYIPIEFVFLIIMWNTYIHTHTHARTHTHTHTHTLHIDNLNNKSVIWKKEKAITVVSIFFSHAHIKIATAIKLFTVTVINSSAFF